MKVEQLTDPGGHVGPPGSLKKKSSAGLDDSDSGLDTTSTSSDSARSSSKVVEQNDKTKNHSETVHEVSTVVVVTRKKPPFMGLALKRNPDLRSGYQDARIYFPGVVGNKKLKHPVFKVKSREMNKSYVMNATSAVQRWLKDNH